METVKEIIEKLKKIDARILIEGENLTIDFKNGTITDDLKTLIKSNKKDLICYIKDIREKKNFAIEKAPLMASYPLSSSQLRLWILSQFPESNIAYNIPSVYELGGDLDLQAIQYAFKMLIERHEILRTVFKQDKDGNIRQFIKPSNEINFSVHFHPFDDLHTDKSEIERNIQTDFMLPFDLSSGPLLRAHIYETSEKDWIFTYVMHHIISDGWSVDILISEILEYYECYKNSNAAVLPPLKIQYKDYAVWQQEQLNSKDLLAHKAYWVNRFSNEISVLELSADNVRPVLKTYNGRIVKKIIDSHLYEDIRMLIHNQDATLFMGLLAVLKTLLYKYTQQEDIVVGTPIASREHIDLENQIGCYINTLALKTQFEHNDSFITLLKKIKEVVLDAYKHQAYPFDELLENIPLKHDSTRNALFDIMIVLQEDKSIQKRLEVEKLKISEFKELNYTISKFDLLFNFKTTSNEFQLLIEYNKDIYGEATIERMANHIEQLFKSIVEGPNLSLNELNYLTYTEEQQVLVEFNNLDVYYPREKTVVDLFEEQVMKHANKLAVIYNQSSLTYFELNAKSNQLAAYLRTAYHVKSNDLIGIELDKSEWMLICILAVLKSGGAYVPIDPFYPETRKDFMRSDSNCKIILNNDELERFHEIEDKYATTNLTQLNRSKDLAYVIYTSGSTGQPKGVLTTHENVVRLFRMEHPLFEFNSEDVWTMFHSFCFDFSVWEIFGALLNGGKLVVVPTLTSKDPSSYINLLIDQHVTILNQTPSSFNNILNEEMQIKDKRLELRYIIFGGEPLAPVILKGWKEKYPRTKLINMYGITETTVHVSYKEITEQDIKMNINNIGRAIPTLSWYIIDNCEKLLPIGVKGEICVGGAGVALGYLNRPELTREKFVENPFKKGDRLYKSGDFGKWLPDGSIEYMGRKDSQVKIRGYRIEISEIERQLQLYPSIDATVVVLKTDELNEKDLIAYVVGKDDLSVSDLRIFLNLTLPSYMIPSQFIQLKSLPLTVNGKIDKDLLSSHGTLLTNVKEYVSPTTEFQIQLVSIWASVLGIEKTKIGINDNFFDLGGNSIKLVALNKQIKELTNKNINLVDLFKYHTIENFSLFYLNEMKPKQAEIIDSKEIQKVLDIFINN